MQQTNEVFIIPHSQKNTRQVDLAHFRAVYDFWTSLVISGAIEDVAMGSGLSNCLSEIDDHVGDLTNFILKKLSRTG